jgi:hypothetical protein
VRAQKQAQIEAREEFARNWYRARTAAAVEEALIEQDRRTTIEKYSVG